MAMQILAFVFILIGAVIAYGAGVIVDRFGIAGRVHVKEAEAFSPEELEKYKRLKALSLVKMAGLFVLLPGVILIFITFR